MKIYILLAFILLSITGIAQVGIGTATPASSAALDVTSTSKGILIPRMTQAQKNAIVSPATGLLIYQTDVTSGFYYYNGVSWVTFGGSAGWALTGNSGTSAATDKLGTTDMQDFSFATNNTEVIRIASSGNVGLGTTSPTTKLHIDGVVTAATTLLNDGFEDNSIPPFTTGGNANWSTTNTGGEFNTGSSGVKSGTIGNNEVSWIQTSVTMPALGGTVSFYYKTSTESCCDELHFYIDGLDQTGSGLTNSSWVNQTYPLTSGVHTLNWAYEKDGGVTSGADEVYLDDVLVTSNSMSNTVLQIIDGTEGVNKVLTSDATGIASWKNPTGKIEGDWLFVSGTANTDAIYHQGNVMIGQNAVSAYNLHLWDGSATSGSSFKMGSVEILTDGVAEIQSSTDFSPITDLGANLGSSAKRWKDVYSVGGMLNTSDKRLKTSIKPLKYGLKEFLKLEPVSFIWKEEKVDSFVIPDNEKEYKLGFIAQEVQKIIPEVIVTHHWKEYEENPGVLVKEENKRLGMRYSDLIPVAIKAIQEQQVKIDTLAKQNERLQELIRKLEKQ